MQFQIERKEFLRLIKNAARATAKKVDVQKLLHSCILIRVAENPEDGIARLEVESYDGKAYIKQNTLQISNCKTGEVAINAEKLVETLANVPEGTLQIRVPKEGLLVLQSESKNLNLMLNCYLTDSFIQLKQSFQPGYQRYLVPAQLLKAVIGSVAFVAMKEEEAIKKSKPAASAVCLDLGLAANVALVAASDGHSLAINKFAVKPSEEPAVHTAYKILLQEEGFNSISGLLDDLKDKNIEIGLNYNGSMAMFKPEGTEQFVAMVATVTGTFPDYRGAIPNPSEYKTKMVVLKESLKTGLKLAKVTAENIGTKIRQATFSFIVQEGSDSGILQIHSKGEGESFNKLEGYHTTGVNGSVSLDVTRVLDVLNVIPDAHVYLAQISANHPLIVLPAEQGRTWTYLVLPMSSREAEEAQKAPVAKKEKIEVVEQEAPVEPEVEAEEPVIEPEAEPLEVAQAAEPIAEPKVEAPEPVAETPAIFVATDDGGDDLLD